MIISLTPLRMSFVGGGTDLPVFYRRFGGAVVSTAINQYVYVTVNKKFDQKIRVSYSRTEEASSVARIRHPLVREAMKMLAIKGGVEITSIADVPSKGTGLGSSSAFTVGALHALHAYAGQHAGALQLAEEACQIEIDRCGEPIGRQDQYAAAFGGLNYIRFNRDDSVVVERIICQRQTIEQIEAGTLTFYTGITRSASRILQQQQDAVAAGRKKQKVMLRMAELARQLRRGPASQPLRYAGGNHSRGLGLEEEPGPGHQHGRDRRMVCQSPQGRRGRRKTFGRRGGGVSHVPGPARTPRSHCPRPARSAPGGFSFRSPGQQDYFRASIIMTNPKNDNPSLTPGGGKAPPILDNEDVPPCLSVVIPVFNEQATIREIVRCVCAQRPVEEVILVDDCSTDGSSAIVDQIAAENPAIRVKHHPVNCGKGAALRTGFALAKGKYVIVQDADLEYNPEEYHKLLAPLLSDKADVVFGSRFAGGGPTRVLYFWHSVGNRVLTLLSNMFTNLNMTDMETCYKVFRREVIQGVKIEENRFGFEPEIVAKVRRVQGIRIYEVPISYYGRTYADGKKISWKDGVRALWCIVKYNSLS